MSLTSYPEVLEVFYNMCRKEGPTNDLGIFVTKRNKYIHLKNVGSSNPHRATHNDNNSHKPFYSYQLAR